MTGPHEHDDQHDPAEQARVRSLLADLGSRGAHPPGPVPDDVVARLDAALAAPPARRRWPQLLVAAAVVVVVGAGAVTATLDARQGESSSSSSGAAGGASSSAEDEAAGGSVPSLTRAGFAAQVPALLADPAAEARRPGRATLSGGCATPPGRGEVVAVRFEGEPAVVAVRPPREGRQVVEAWSCDASTVLARTRVAAPGR